MPCYDGRVNEKQVDQSDRIVELSGWINDYARLCCDFCKQLEVSGNGHLIEGDMKEWWTAHKEFDKSHNHE